VPKQRSPLSQQGRFRQSRTSCVGIGRELLNGATPDSNVGRGRWIVVTALGTSTTLVWASSYYLPAILTGPIATGTGVSPTWVFAAFSASLLIAASVGPFVGRAIDRHGGRGVLALSSVVLAVGLVSLALATGPVGLFGAWVILGVGMALGLYDAGFAALTAIYGNEARGPITSITLFGGFSSTISWPLSTLLNDAIGWRETCLAWAALNLLIGLPLNRFVFPKRVHQAPHREECDVRIDREQSIGRIGWRPYREMLLLAFVFAAAWFVTAALAAHLPALLERTGLTQLQAVAAAALFGPAQVAARMAELVVLRKIHPLVSSRIAACLHPIGAAILAVGGPPAAAVFVVLHGAGNGLLTIAQGTVPLAIFGPHGYGSRTGLLGAPARIAQAFAPLLFGLLMDRMGLSVLFVSASLYIAAFAALMCVRASRVEGTILDAPS
jgi:predicted MFS family arabinose efflux permease